MQRKRIEIVNRVCQPELLDHLPPADPGAVQSRRDLRRVNSLMGNGRFMAEALETRLRQQCDPRILEIGAGDGSFFLRIAKRLCKLGKPTAILLDRQNLVTAETRAQFQDLGWQAETITEDVFEHFSRADQTDQTRPTSRTPPFYSAIIANLFLHHFSKGQLEELFRLLSQRTAFFVAVEPRRAVFPLVTAKLLWAVGCNSVTRHDAVVSVRAGFRNQELSDLWPRADSWSCTERRAGLFSHLFMAAKRNDS